jgi:hypothetical protein
LNPADVRRIGAATLRKCAAYVRSVGRDAKAAGLDCAGSWYLRKADALDRDASKLEKAPDE